MKYKVGDEVLVKVRIHNIVNQKTDMPYEVKERNNGKINPRTIWIGEEDIQPHPQMTAEEAWELAMKIEAMRSDALLKIFDMDSVYCILQDFTPMEAKAKIKAWEAENEIKVGDVVTVSAYEGIVTRDVDEQGYYALLLRDGDVGYYQRSSFKNTGRHIDIDGLLNQIGGSDA